MNDAFDYAPEDAFHGPLGEYTREIEDHIEVDRFTFFVQFLAVIGTLIGRRVRCLGGHTPHHCNLFGLVIGPTGIGKGSAWSLAERVATRLDPAFNSLRSFDVQSAPGLIQLVTDGSVRPAKKRRSTLGEESPAFEVVVPAVKDKRRLIVNEEMQAVLTAKGRRGATLGQLLKLAWDGKDLENNAKDQLRATSPHVGFLGHITPEDFREALRRDKADRTNGFYNRFLLVTASHVRSLPFGGNPPDCEALVQSVRSALLSLGPSDPLGTPHTLSWGDDARGDWEAFYNACKSGHPFLSGLDGFHDRLPPQVMRVAMIFAVIDHSATIRKHHLGAAKALCLHLLDESRSLLCQGSPSRRRNTLLLNRIRDMMASKTDFFTKTDVWHQLGRHGNAAEVDLAISALLTNGEWTAETIQAENHRDMTLYRVVGNCPQPQADPTPARTDQLVWQGHKIGLGAHFSTPRPIDALDLDDKPVCLSQGVGVHLAQNPLDASKEDADWLASVASRKPNHRLVVIDGELPRLLPLKVAVRWASGQSLQ